MLSYLLQRTPQQPQDIASVQKKFASLGSELPAQLHAYYQFIICSEDAHNHLLTHERPTLFVKRIQQNLDKRIQSLGCALNTLRKRAETQSDDTWKKVVELARSAAINLCHRGV